MTLRLVKYLYYDDETGQLVLDCGGPSAVRLATLVQGRIPCDQAAFPAEKIGSPLPPADAEHEGRIITHETDPMGQAPWGLSRG